MADKTDDLRKRAKTRADFTKRDWENLKEGQRVFGEDFGNEAGTFKEYAGGGTPLKKGEKAPSKEWVEKNRVMQPRDEDGKFTYNAVNLKDLKYGPSRGKTRMPLFKKDLFDKFFAKNEVGIINAKTKARVIVKSFEDMESFEQTFKEYREKSGMGFMNTSNKRGRWSNKEKETLEKSKKSGKPEIIPERFNKRFKKKEQKPKPEPGAESKKDKVFKKKESTPTQKTSNLKQTAENNKELIGQIVNLGVSPADATKIVSSGKITSIEQFKQIMGL